MFNIFKTKKIKADTSIKDNFLAELDAKQRKLASAHDTFIRNNNECIRKLVLNQLVQEDINTIKTEAKRISAIVEPLYSEIRKIEKDPGLSDEEKTGKIAEIEQQIYSIPLDKVELKTERFTSHLFTAHGFNDRFESNFYYKHFFRDVNGQSLEDKFKDYTEVCDESDIEKVRELEKELICLGGKVNEMAMLKNGLIEERQRDRGLGITEDSSWSKFIEGTINTYSDIIRDTKVKIKNVKKQLLSYTPSPIGYYYIDYDKYRCYGVGLHCPEMNSEG